MHVSLVTHFPNLANPNPEEVACEGCQHWKMYCGCEKAGSLAGLILGRLKYMHAMLGTYHLIPYTCNL